MDPDEFRASGHRVVDLLADYLAEVERYAVFPPVEPGDLRPLFAPSAPETPEPVGDILADISRLILPNVTHWQHPGFLAYFATAASGIGILGEMLTAGIGSNAMLWRTSPVATELEGVIVDWFRQALGLPEGLDGLITDTASTSTLIALAAAREAAGIDASRAGLAGRHGPGGLALRVYGPTETHSSSAKACMTLGIGRDHLVRVPVDEAYALRPDALAAAIASDRAAGQRPLAVVATVGTTSSTSIDPVAAIAEIAAREGLWLHVDAAYAGATALLPDRRGPFTGWERADSIVVNPHKWFFALLDASLLLTRRIDDVRAAFSLVPEYLRTLDRDNPARDYNELTSQLGRRFRALKLWMLLRWFGLEGLRRRISVHIELAAAFAGWLDASSDFERLAPVPFSTVCFRYRPAALAGRADEPDIARRLDDLNARLLDAVNRSGEVFLSHTRLRDRFTIRLAIGNLRTEKRHVRNAWDLLRDEAARLAPEDRTS
ncbi:MAG: amino acid decarboxylase [Chloroflexi bacterium]|nr:amino acid decarboxylase [Chloroflexota bacterium]